MEGIMSAIKQIAMEYFLVLHSKLFQQSLIKVENDSDMEEKLHKLFY